MSKKWIQKATANSHGQFREKAEKAGMSTREYAEKEKGAGGLLGKQANLALNLMGASHGNKEKKTRSNAERRNKLYGSKE